MFAMNHYSIVPDITVVGKALGAYCPLTAAIFSKSVSQAFDDNVFGHGQSYSGHALACAAALASLRALEEQNLVERSRKMGEYLGGQLIEISRKHPSVGDVRGIGLFWTMELVKNRETKEPLRRPTEKYKETVVRRIAEYMLNERNIYIPGDKFGIWIVPPLIIIKEEVDFLVDAIDDALKIADAEVK
jgi:taurine--2-oxoglutarate transaminase